MRGRRRREPRAARRRRRGGRRRWSSPAPSRSPAATARRRPRRPPPPVGETATVERARPRRARLARRHARLRRRRGARRGRGGHAHPPARPGRDRRRGESLYCRRRAAAWLLYGALPAWRDFAPGMDDGEDVRQLERNLRALGSDPAATSTVDDEWDWATTAAVERFQDERGLDETGTLDARPGRLPARARADRRGAARPSGERSRPGGRSAAISSTRREVDRRPRRDRQSLAARATRVTVELPTGGRRAAASRTSARSREPAGRGAATRRSR